MDRLMVLTECPVKLFKPEVRALFDLFYLTHAIDAFGRWTRIALPAIGGVGDQIAVELDALAWMAHVWNARIAEARRPRKDR